MYVFIFVYILWSVYVFIMGSIYYEQYYGNGIDFELFLGIILDKYDVFQLKCLFRIKGYKILL